jgi:hypothetical protein
MTTLSMKELPEQAAQARATRIEIAKTEILLLQQILVLVAVVAPPQSLFALGGSGSARAAADCWAERRGVPR